MKQLTVILGNQLFPRRYYNDYKDDLIYMAEDRGLCTHFKYHKHKLVLFLSAMRHYAQDLKDQGFDVYYQKLEEQKKDYPEALMDFCQKKKIKKVMIFEIEDKFFEKKLQKLFEKSDIELFIRQTPFFLNTRDEFKEYLDGVKKPFMKTFYEQMRSKTGYLMKDDKPVGGKYSYDSENRKKLPKNIDIPSYNIQAPDDTTEEVIKLVEKEFSNHPGEAKNFWLPVTRVQSLAAIRDFLDYRFQEFGHYQDAITDRDPFLFHSILSPLINLGLITPEEVVEKTLEYAHDNDIDLNCTEGFLRQVIGWREFVRGIYQNFSEKQDQENFWKHKKKLPKKWYEAKTQIPLLDDAIKKAYKFGYNHHIERLMVMGNMMVLLEIDPKEAHEWFMQMYVDSSDWVMGPNVYGMALYSDGGIFATKPYICGGSYYQKMGDYKKGEWVDICNALYWRFISKHLSYFESQYRLSMIANLWKKMDKKKQDNYIDTAEKYIKELWS